MCRGAALEYSAGVCPRCITKTLLPQGVSLPGSYQLLFISDGICLRPGDGGSFPPLSNRQFSDLPVFLCRTLCQGALSHFPSKEEDVSSSRLLAEAARSQFVAHEEGFLFPVVHSCLQPDHSCKIFTFRGKCISRYASLLD